MGGQTMKVPVDQREEFGLCVRTTPPEFTEQSCYFPRRRLHGYIPLEPIGAESYLRTGSFTKKISVWVGPLLGRILALQSESKRGGAPEQATSRASLPGKIEVRGPANPLASCRSVLVITDGG
jgi:hypothetical protein